MSRKCLSSSDKNGRRLPSLQTPLRRSPRFLSQKTDECTNTNRPDSSKKPKRRSKSHRRSAPISPNPEEIPSSSKTKQGHPLKFQREPSRPIETLQGPRIPLDASRSRRRSPRLASNSSEPSTEAVASDATSLLYPEVITSGKKTRQGFSLESRKNPSRSIGTQKAPLEESQRKRLRSIGMLVEAPQPRRRSPRSASNSAEVMKNGFDLDATIEGCNARERRRPATLISSVKVPGKSEVGFNLMDDERVSNTMRVRRNNGSRPSLTTRVGGDKKRRKMEGNGEENVEIERIETEEHSRLPGCTNEKEKGCGKKVGIGRAEIGECRGFEGWTEDQELALQRAYFVARPSPHFWKKVSKLVPGKTAQECFDRVHADFATPPQPRPRSRKNKTNLSPIGHFSLSANKSSELTQPKMKRLRSSKKKNLVAVKTARHLLQKHCLIDQSHEADHFSVLETSPSALEFDFQDIRTPEIPDFTSNPPIFLQKCNARSSSANKSLTSRSKPPTRPKHASPEVLKQIKNMALHEKYIDILHCREARRRTFSKASSSLGDREHASSSVLKTGVRAARTALVSEARDVISHFQHMQANTLGNHEGLDDDDDDDE